MYYVVDTLTSQCLMFESLNSTLGEMGVNEFLNTSRDYNDILNGRYVVLKEGSVYIDVQLVDGEKQFSVVER